MSIINTNNNNKNSNNKNNNNKKMPAPPLQQLAITGKQQEVVIYQGEGEIKNMMMEMIQINILLIVVFQVRKMDQEPAKTQVSAIRLIFVRGPAARTTDERIFRVLTSCLL